MKEISVDVYLRIGDDNFAMFFEATGLIKDWFNTSSGFPPVRENKISTS